MKKSVLAVAVLGAFTGVASAQSSVTVYGIVDVGLVAERGAPAGSVNKLSSGVASGSRLGFKGTEDLGGGLSASFVLENGFQADTGALGQGGALFGRQAFAGLGGAFGTVTLGRQYTPQYLALAFVDPFGTGLAGDATNLMQSTGDASSRMNNSIKYATPNLAGFTGELAYGFGEVNGSNKAGRQYGASVGYAIGPFAVRLGHHNRNNLTATPTPSDTQAKNTLLAATYNLNVVKLHAGYGINKGPNSSTKATTDSADALVGVTVPFGAHTLLASFVRKNDKTSLNQDADQWGVGYRYALSKRTDLYTAFARIKNKNGATYTVGNAIEAGTGDKAFNVGVRHTF